MAEFLNGWKRSHHCGVPCESELGQDLTLMGWVDGKRNLGGLIFAYLRDRSGMMQVVFDESRNDRATFEKAEGIRSEFVLAVKGVLARRAPEAINPDVATGAFELLVSDFKILAVSETPPFMIDDDSETNEMLRMQYRYLDLRRPVMQRILALRHRIAKVARDYYDAQGFYEIETPILGRSTPEGARDYLVPSRVYPGQFYALPQSPQQFKQLLMLSGFDRYFQIAKCFRDEDLRADRQPEFTQIDCEMSFVEDEEDVMAVHEGFMAELFRKIKGIEIPLPLPRMKYAEAMARYGSDKPDTRFGLELVDVSDIMGSTEAQFLKDAIAAGGSVRAINAVGSADKLSRKEIDKLVEFVKTYRAKGMSWMTVTADGVKSTLAKFMTEAQIASLLERVGAKANDTVFFVCDADDEVVFAALGALRLELAKRFDLIDPDRFDLLWVTEFPLFEYDAEDGRYYAKHHPFTSPKLEDLDKLESDPASVRAKAYDMVLNGYELGGGSIRISNQELQKRMFRALGFTDESAAERFGYFLRAFQYGAPPHGGIAFGLDRIVMLMAGTNNIRDVIAFPKTQNASDLLTQAPNAVDDAQLAELGICIDKRGTE